MLLAHVMYVRILRGSIHLRTVCDLVQTQVCSIAGCIKQERGIIFALIALWAHMPARILLLVRTNTLDQQER